MALLQIGVYSVIWVLCYLKRREYVLASLLVGQPLLKAIINPFPKVAYQQIYLGYYVILGFLVDVMVAHKPRKAIRLRRRPFGMLVTCIGFGILLVVSAIWSANTQGLDKAMDYFTVNMVIVCFTVLTIRSEGDFHRVMSAVADVALIVGTVTAVLVFLRTGSPIVRVATSVAKDISLGGINFAVSIWYGRRVGLGCLCMLARIHAGARRLDYVKASVLFVLTLLSASRGPIISLVVTVFGMAFILGGARFWKSLVYTGVIGIICILVFLVFAGELQLLSRVLRYDDSNVIARIRMLQTGLRMIVDHPLGLGVGGYAVSDEAIESYPHNIFLEIGVEMGLVVLALFVVWLGAGFWKSIRLARLAHSREIKAASAFAFCSLLFGFVNAQFSGTISSNELTGSAWPSSHLGIS